MTVNRYGRYKKYILYIIFILNIFIVISCAGSQNPDETVILNTTGETDIYTEAETENDELKEILYELEQLQSENSDNLSKLDIMREELESIKDEYSVLDNSYSEKLSELESTKLENDLLKSQIEQMKAENEKYEMDRESEAESEAEKAEIITEAPVIDAIQELDEVKAEPQVKGTVLYVLNKSTKKFHISTCGSASSIKAENYAETYDRSYAVKNGYDACKKCNP